jgi:hypothetical protein
MPPGKHLSEKAGLEITNETLAVLIDACGIALDSMFDGEPDVVRGAGKIAKARRQLLRFVQEHYDGDIKEFMQDNGVNSKLARGFGRDV